MSGQFIIEYAGAPVKMPEVRMVPEDQATHFNSEPDAWIAALQFNLTPKYISVRCTAAQADKAPLK